MKKVRTPDLEDELCEDCEGLVGFDCHDCGVDTAEIGEYYMVTNSCWKKAGNVDGFLCIGCLEKRVGRKLSPRNFIDCALNWRNAIMPGYASIRLMSRMHGSRKSVWTERATKAVIAAFVDRDSREFEEATLTDVSELFASFGLPDETSVS